MVTPSSGDDHSWSPSLGQPSGSPSPSLVYSSDNHSQYPPSPTLSTASSSPGGYRTSLALRYNDPTHIRGHSPTKSIDSSFRNNLDASAAKQRQSSEGGGHQRRTSGATDLSTFTALDGPKAVLQIDSTDEQSRDVTSVVGAGIGGKKVIHNKRKRRTFIGKIPLLKRLAKQEELEDEDEQTSALKKAGGILTILPDPSPDQMGKFGSLVPSSLTQLIDPKSVSQLRDLGGDKGLMEKLFVNEKMGLSASTAINGTDIQERQRIYGENRIPQRKSKSLLELMWIAFQDKILILLSIAAVVSLALGIYQAVGQPPDTYLAPECPGGVCTIASLNWVEGVAIVVAIVVVVMVGSVNDYQKELQFRKLNAKKDDRNVKCIRDGSERLISVYDIVVGDICMLEPGEIIPVDGVFLSGHNVRCDESSATGESDAIRKVSYKEYDESKVKSGTSKMDCFLLSGSKVTEGSGLYVVTAVGQHSFLGKIMMCK